MIKISQKTGGAALVALAVLLLGACRRPQSESQTARVDGLFRQWSGPHTPGCAVGISRNGTVLYEHGYGMANLELNVPVTPDTVFDLGSISKSLTATSVVVAAQRGLLSLDDEVHKYVPEWANRDDRITIRHLLTHTSGVRDAFTLLGWAPLGASAGDQNDAIAKLLARQRGLNFAPGTEFQYNNGGYNLLGTIIRRATGQSLRVFTEANVFKPLGMTHSQVRDDVSMLVPNRASGYSRKVDSWHQAKNYAVGNSAAVGNSGAYSTVRDMLQWTRNFDEARVGTPALLAAMQTPAPLSGGRTAPYGFGLGIEQYRGLRTIRHSGAGYGVATTVTRYPEQRLATAVLCNVDSDAMGGSATINPDAISNSIADIYLASVLGPVEPTRTAGERPVKLSEAELSDKAGLYRAVGADLPMRMTVSHGALMMRSLFQDDNDVEIVALGANRFLFQDRLPFEFISSADGRSKEWHVGDGQSQRILQLVTFEPSAAELRSYAGRYYSEELDATFGIFTQGSALIVKSAGNPDGTLAPFSRNIFVGDVFGIVKFVRDDRGTVTGFTLNRHTARGVRFDRMK